MELRKIANNIQTQESTAQSLLTVNQCPTCAQPVDQLRLKGINDRILHALKDFYTQLVEMKYSQVIEKDYTALIKNPKVLLTDVKKVSS